MALKEYKVHQNGIEYTVQMEEDLAKEQGLTPKETGGKPATTRGRAKTKENDELPTTATKAKTK